MAAAAPTSDAQAPAVEKPAAAEAAAPGAGQKPKKAVSAYWLFSSKVREEITKEIKEKNGGKAGLGDIAKATTARWATFSDEQKKEFEDKAAEDKKRYAEEFKAYLEANDPAGTLRTKYAHLIPKKPMTGYFLFLQEPSQKEKAVAALKEAGSEATHKQVVSKLAEMWKAASAEEKAPFEERHKQEQAEFLKKQMEWQATPEFKEIEAAAKRQAEQQKEEGQEVATPTKGAKRSRSVAKAGSPKGEEAKKEAQPSPAGATKRAKKAPPAQEPQVAIDADVLAEASKAGLEGMLRNLASRPEVVAAGKKSREVFEALKAAGGLVNPAKRALVGAGGA
uniref:HMG box domain-containing protein n=1 Tax=Alexandrium catenella TaxID=2925 RepID=A0A7S1RYL3_ALECA